ncbi:phosphotransferase [Vibrio sp. JC009]|uniref:phosphotransferase n=1 Tax=Vibrio sp. JC009 TaxID=2912314 RepID=UPI0023B1915C|nr:phosphotransferase [Vibrio sp. JC009]WED20812.1 phosphotransferase [Vibrio sp. JC009]
MEKWSESVHLLLNYIEQKGFIGAPKLIGTDNNREQLSYVEGETYDSHLIGAIASEEALTSAAALLRQYHDATEGFLDANKGKKLHWMLASRGPEEVICHGDFAPYNVALDGNKVVGVYDFDAAHPAPRMWDIAYSVYCWAPLKACNYESHGSLPVQVSRAKLFCESYGVDARNYTHLVDWVILRIQALVYFMVSQADQGEPKYKQDIQEGHHLSYLRDIEYLKQNKDEITGILLESMHH